MSFPSMRVLLRRSDDCGFHGAGAGGVDVGATHDVVYALLPLRCVDPYAIWALVQRLVGGVFRVVLESLREPGRGFSARGQTDAIPL